MLEGLDKKDIDVDLCVDDLVKNKDIISEYLDGLVSKNETYRYNCFKVLNIVSEEKPGLLYPYWNFFIDHLRSDNNYHKMSAVLIIANLTSVDKENRFENVFEEFFENLNSKKTVVPIYVVKSSGRIVNYKPYLEGKITGILLDIENIHPGKQIELVKSAVIESFSEYFYNSKSKDEIISFVKKQLDSESPKTRKTAKEFLNKYVEK